ncbi:hypothetical protein [Afipia carboxidovorans]|uniref:hypothetical protein n=1 Tax=Afipia carboxidovorans TaxID=40137 RepID=UPI001872B3D7|nr:hypothetical protein [Afipia carboxidovorans]
MAPSARGAFGVGSRNLALSRARAFRLLFFPDAFLQCIAQIQRHVMLLHQIGESLVRELLKRRHPPAAEFVQLGQRIVVELDAFSGHGSPPVGLRFRNRRTAIQ